MSDSGPQQFNPRDSYGHDDARRNENDNAVFPGAPEAEGEHRNIMNSTMGNKGFEPALPPNFPQHPNRPPLEGGTSDNFSVPLRTPGSSSYGHANAGGRNLYANDVHSDRPTEGYPEGRREAAQGFQVGADNNAEPPTSLGRALPYLQGGATGEGRSVPPGGGNYTAAQAQHGFGYPQSGGTSPKKAYGMGALISGMIVAALIGGATAVGTTAFFAKGVSGSASTTVETKRIINNQENVNNITAVVEKAAPSIVTIGARSGSSAGSGSGIIMDNKGNILTNTHVVTLDGQARNPMLEVRLRDGQVYPAKTVGLDPISDLAVVKVDAQGLSPAVFGDSAKLNVGENVVAIGSPLGLEDTATDGIVSNLNRTIQVSSSAAPENSDSDGGSSEDDRKWNFAPPRGLKMEGDSQTRGSVALNVIQTDASINPGNSGGGLLNRNGEVIGVNVAIASAGGGSFGPSGSIGVGFSIPSNYAKRIADELIEKGHASHGQLGVSVKEKKSNADSTFNTGAEIVRFTSNSSAQKAGLKQGDIILAVDQRLVSSPTELNAVIREQPGGSEVNVRYLRGKEEKTAKVVLSDAE